MQCEAVRVHAAETEPCARAEGSSGLRLQGPEGPEGAERKQRLRTGSSGADCAAFHFPVVTGVRCVTLKHLLSGNNCD